jgi:hypothetical protein
MDGGRTGFKSPKIEIDGSYNDQFMVGPDTLAAKDALAKVSDNKGICLLQTGVMRHRI